MDASIKHWFSVYCDSRTGELRPSSRKVYGAWWNQFGEFLTKRSLRIEQASAGDIRAFLAGYAGNTAIRYFRLLSDVYDVAAEAGLCTTNPLKTLTGTYGKEEASVPVVAPGDETVAALYALPRGRTWKNARDRALVLLAAETGLRRHELINLTLSDAKPEGLPPRVTVRSSAQKREVALGPDICQEITTWLQARRAAGIQGLLLFPAAEEGQGLDPSTGYRIIERQLSRVGAGKAALGSSGAHALRAGFAARAQNDGKRLSEVQNLLGHRQVTSTVDLLERIEGPTSV